jgi:hypothetical protein
MRRRGDLHRFQYVVNSSAIHALLLWGSAFGTVISLLLMAALAFSPQWMGAHLMRPTNPIGWLDALAGTILFGGLLAVYAFRFARSVRAGDNGLLVRRLFYATEVIGYRDISEIVEQRGWMRVRYRTEGGTRSFWLVPDTSLGGRMATEMIRKAVVRPRGGASVF